MSVQPDVSESLPNGLPPHFGKPHAMPSPVPFNGVDSSHSSRTASPANRLQQIPASQLPPPRASIPASQLPPGAAIGQLSQNYAQLSISQTTPATSPKVSAFTTSTPVLGPVVNKVAGQSFNQNREFSPIITGTNGQRTSSTFTHSAQSSFTNVSSNNTQIKTDVNQFQNIPLGIESNDGNTGSNNFPRSTVPKPVNATSNDKQQPGNQNVVLQGKTMLNSQEQQNQQKPLASAFFQQTTYLADGVQKMQQSSSQPLFETHKTPITNTSVVSQPFMQPPKSLPSYGSTPNLYHNPSQIANHSSAQSYNQPPVSTYQRTPQNLQQRNGTHPLPHQQQQNVQRSLQPFQNIPMQKMPALPNKPMEQIYPPHNFPPQPSINSQQLNAPNVPTQTNSQTIKANLHANRYPTAMQHYPAGSNISHLHNVPQNAYHNQSPADPRTNTQHYEQRNVLNSFNQNYQQSYGRPNVVQEGFTKMWGQENYDLLQCPNILPPMKVEPPRISLGQDFLDAANCSPDIFRCTMTKIPETNTLLQKCRLPLGILIHPFKDLDHLPVIQCSTIVRCRACRTYINPFVFFVDTKRWKCNLCYRVNELPEEFQFDPVSKTYGDPARRPEIKSSTIEYIAPSEYMLRPPQPAVYLFLLDVSHAAVDSGYLHIFCNVLTSCLSNLPGDSRTQVGFVAYNSALHFYSLAEGLSQPHEMTVLDVEDVFLPCPDNLIVNLQERKELISDLLTQLPTRFSNSYDAGSSLGAALQAAHKMIAGTGGRITVFQASLPNIGPGALTVREDPSQRAGTEVQHLNPANDFYKRLALECSGQQIAVDLFIVNSQYVDLATISGISRFSGGCIHHFPLFKANRILQAEGLERTLKRYLTRKIGFEAVMRIRCTRGLSIHTFHGNFFVRSTDLLSLPNVNPEAGFGMQVSIDESLSDLHTVCFQAALLYTSSKGERRIRVHTLCVPIVATLPEVLASADQQCIIGLLAKMAVDRSMQSSLADAREAFINVAIDILSSYKASLNLGSSPSALLVPQCLRLQPLYISALLKHVAFRTGTSTRLDDRVKAMCDMKSLPLYLLIQQIYPDLYPVHNLEDQNTTLSVDGEPIPQPPHLQLSARSLDSKGAFLMDMGEHMVLLVGPAVSQGFLKEALGVPDYASISDSMCELPNFDNLHSQRLNSFINSLNDEKPFQATLQVIRENSPVRNIFVERLIEDRIETALSYHEFLQHLKTQVK